MFHVLHEVVPPGSCNSDLECSLNWIWRPAFSLYKFGLISPGFFISPGVVASQIFNFASPVTPLPQPTITSLTAIACRFPRTHQCNPQKMTAWTCSYTPGNSTLASSSPSFSNPQSQVTLDAHQIASSASVHVSIAFTTNSA